MSLTPEQREELARYFKDHPVHKFIRISDYKPIAGFRLGKPQEEEVLTTLKELMDLLKNWDDVTHEVSSAE